MGWFEDNLLPDDPEDKYKYADFTIPNATPSPVDDPWHSYNPTTGVETTGQYVPGGNTPSTSAPPFAAITPPGTPPYAAPTSDVKNNTDQSYFQDPKTAQAWLDQLAARTGASVQAGDLSQLQGKKPEDFEKFQRDLEAQYARRGSNTPAGATGGGSTGGGGSSSGGGGGVNQTLLNAAGGVYYPGPYASNPNAPAIPGMMAPYVAPTWQGGDFREPTMDEVKASPGYQVRLDAGNQAIQRRAAAQGTAYSGGTLKALERYGQDYGTGEYQTYRSNAFQDYLTKYGQFVDKGNADFGARQQNLSETNTDYSRRVNAYDSENQRTLTDYLTNNTAQRGASNDYWDRLIAIYNGGRATAGGSYQPPV